MTTTLGRRSGNRSAMFSASWRLTPALGNARCRRPARVLVSSLSARRPPAASRPSAAAAASVPVPADGSSTTSRAVTLAQAATHQASSSGVENCWKRCCTSSRRVWGGSRRAIRAMRARTPAGSGGPGDHGGPEPAQQQRGRHLARLVRLLPQPGSLGVRAAERGGHGVSERPGVDGAAFLQVAQERGAGGEDALRGFGRRGVRWS